MVARSSPYAYGCDVLVKYNDSLDEHKRRGFIKHSTGKKVKYGWSEIVPHVSGFICSTLKCDKRSICFQGQLLRDGYTPPVSYYKTFTRKAENLKNIEVGELYAATQPASKGAWVFDRDGEPPLSALS